MSKNAAEPDMPSTVGEIAVAAQMRGAPEPHFVENPAAVVVRRIGCKHAGRRFSPRHRSTATGRLPQRRPQLM